MRWNSKQLTTSCSHVPARAGVYVIGHQLDTLGLSTTIVVAYVGKSTNLRRRLSEHTRLRELNDLLSKYLANRGLRTMVWYITDLSDTELDRTERLLIRELDPPCNRLRYKEGTSDA